MLGFMINSYRHDFLAPPEKLVALRALRPTRQKYGMVWTLSWSRTNFGTSHLTWNHLSGSLIALCSITHPLRRLPFLC